MLQAEYANVGQQVASELTIKINQVQEELAAAQREFENITMEEIRNFGFLMRIVVIY